MHSNLIIDIDIQDESEKAKNMANQIKKIINKYREYPLDEPLFNAVFHEIEEKQEYFANHNFPPMFVLVTMYGVALVDGKQKQVKLAERSIMSPKYKVTKEQIKRGSIL